jgi:hypothetical protein
MREARYAETTTSQVVSADPQKNGKKNPRESFAGINLCDKLGEPMQSEEGV